MSEDHLPDGTKIIFTTKESLENINRILQKVGCNMYLENTALKIDNVRTGTTSIVGNILISDPEAKNAGLMDMYDLLRSLDFLRVFGDDAVKI